MNTLPTASDHRTVVRFAIVTKQAERGWYVMTCRVDVSGGLENPPVLPRRAFCSQMAATMFMRRSVLHELQRVKRVRSGTDIEWQVRVEVSVDVVATCADDGAHANKHN